MRKILIVTFTLLFVLVLVSVLKRSICNGNVVVDDKLVIMTMDEGLIDQLNYYLFGEKIKKLGYKVKYDISWYKTVGSASRRLNMSTRLKKFFGVLPSVNSRTFQLKQAFPHLDFDVASKKEIEFYKKHFTFLPKNRLWSFGSDYSPHPPVYMPVKCGNWYSFCKDMFDCTLTCAKKEVIQKIVSEYFHFEDSSILDDKNLAILAKIRSAKCPIGVHVRCGDLSEFSSTAEYFVKALNKAKEMFPDASFFFVSDEPDYVRKELLPKLDKKMEIEIIDINNVDACYKDLFLISECKHQIRSYGSMGAIAYLINKWPGKKLISPKIVRDYRNITPDFIIEE